MMGLLSGLQKAKIGGSELLVVVVVVGRWSTSGAYDTERKVYVNADDANR
jgi:hypothetical protein